MKKILGVLLLLSLSSCERFIEETINNYKERREQERYVSPYMGLWEAQYTGDENGVFTLEVMKSGHVHTTRTSGAFYEEASIGRVLHDGSLLQVYSGSSQFLIQGSLVLKKGEWKIINKNLSGTWTIRKID